MTAEILSGTAMRAAILDELRQEVAAMRERHGKTPGLATILVGENPAAVSYVTLKVRTAQDLGFHEIQDTRPETIGEADLLALIARHNADPGIHGILVQLPLPGHIDAERVMQAIDPDKDVDGFHPLNLGRLVLHQALFPPCTPAGIQEMLLRANVPLAGAEVVVVGRSNIVGRPLSIMLGQKGRGADATVTLVHSRSLDVAAHCRRADILVVAAGVPHLVKAAWIKPGATVIDVGVNRIGVNAATGKAILSGDVDFEKIRQVAGRITPVPGGVGPMTIALLMRNTVRAAWRHLAMAG
ncbi:MAG: bifunctional 5,10-methylene-tetrahydrofolate dehydrogenase/5,10-methylene-tetrahydrofolate cyclohydrolase [Deltaproteobacteria bacterium]|jgi:methylenetetrahydrofolate dehydrogenase (NADP+)/methenyltetrahydrofolate cyclohydrolase|nr:bifunctional 5,10-methylene-tetrahydrofolate dehydrogenase/5,10-methylene-tetrahydrofolate cyclohydrolase [Deltaproteobacteria bacterium]